ncbi:unnamed protein product [Spirodela intermedia]|uniref:RNA helicase n=1 Tax=Spirodela intermedia TaxID=51605 RepID=A0A7I8KN11_SPIIN|nr:unnamed protein product [Spirodela intermedia]
MSSVQDKDPDEQYSVLEEEGGVRFLDFDDQSLRHFDPLDEGPVIISMPFPFTRGKPQATLVGQTAADLLTIRNATEDPVDLWSVRIFSSNPKDSFLLSLMRPPQEDSNEEEVQSFLGSTFLEDRVLQPDETLSVWLSCRPEGIGMHTAVLHIVAGDEKYERVAFLLADDPLSQTLASCKPFARAPRRKKFALDSYVPASQPSRPFKREFRRRLPQYPIPRDLRAMIEDKKVPNVIREGLNNRNYSNFFSSLLVVEEIYLEGQMRGYDMECVAMRRKGSHLLTLEVHGLAERRPSLVYGDSLFVKPAFKDHGDDTRPYQGFIHKVEADEILLSFAVEFHEQHHEAKRYDVSFSFNRLCMRRLYQALQMSEQLDAAILFPSNPSKRRVIRTNASLVPLNKTLNHEQLQSVEKILGCRGGPPYVIYGPPGTGKTVTLVEAILQICRRQPQARILVCAPSNSAADHILDKLIGEGGAEVEGGKISRLNAESRHYDDLKADHIQFCFLDGMVFQCPPMEVLLCYTIIVSTYMSSCLLYAQGVRKGHFTHIFLDEAGQASEPETMVPLTGLCSQKTVIILAGDPMQLGPVVCSSDADGYGLGRSYLQRLFDFEVYESEDPNYLTKLVRNYRSHPTILDIPSRLFYKGELIACKKGNASMYELLDIPNKQFPVLFVGIQGCDEREGSNPSWFNRTEVSKVVEIVRKVRAAVDLMESDIGVITPYRQQVIKLRKAFESLDVPDVKIGSVEEFQGQEREVMILSTVRSTVKYNEFDRVHNLGFLTNPRRFNVAITRARSLLVIVGNPHVITKDLYWDQLLRYCADNGSYQGCPLPEPEMPNLPPQDSQSKVAEWDDQLPSLYSDEQLPSQYSNEVEWDEQLPSQHSKEVDWDEQLPNQHSKEVEWDEHLPSQYSKEVEWDKQLPSQHLKEAEWNEWLCGEDRNGDGWKEAPPNQLEEKDEPLRHRHNQAGFGCDDGGQQPEGSCLYAASWRPVSGKSQSGRRKPKEALRNQLPEEDEFPSSHHDQASFGCGSGGGGRQSEGECSYAVHWRPVSAKAQSQSGGRKPEETLQDQSLEEGEFPRHRHNQARFGCGDGGQVSEGQWSYASHQSHWTPVSAKSWTRRGKPKEALQSQSLEEDELLKHRQNQAEFGCGNGGQQCERNCQYAGHWRPVSAESQSQSGGEKPEEALQNQSSEED